ncbi:hypothetical protein Tco_0825167 [Tanacetum coccineum]
MTKKRRIPPFSKPKSPYKVRVILPMKQVAETQQAEVTVATADATKRDDTERLKTSDNQNVKEEKDVEFVSIEEVAEEQSKEIPTVEQLLDEVDKQNKVVQETPEKDSDYESMPEDNLRSVSGFKATDSDNTQGNDVSHSDHIFQNDNASAECLSLPDHMDHICKEVSSLHSKLGDMESSIIHQVSAEIKSSLPALVTTALQEQLPRLLLATLKDCLLSIL